MARTSAAPDAPRQRRPASRSGILMGLLPTERRRTAEYLGETALEAL